MFELRAKSNSQADILMYGSVGEWNRINARDVHQNLVDAKTKGYEKVKYRMNCMGGSIYEGIAIISAIQNSGIDVSAAIDGIAASMGAAIIACIDDVEMAEGARLMIHQGSSAASGQAWQIRDQADLLDSLNRTLAEYFSKKTGKDRQWILDNWMAAGKDKWFTAQEALDAKLIKRIIPGKAKPMPKEEATYHEMAAHYEQFFKNEDTMNRDELIALLGLAATATDAEIKAAMAANKTKAEAADAAATAAAAEKAKDTSKGTDTVATDKALAIDGIVALGKERGMDDKQLASLKVLAGVDVKAAMDMIPTKATETSTVSIAQMIADASKGGVGAVNKADRKTWGWKEWSEEPAAFAELLKTNPAEYQRIFKAEFNYEPTLAELQGVVFK